MFIDEATLRDLDILPMPYRRGTTLWSLIDHTRTTAGAGALRRRLLEPPEWARAGHSVRRTRLLGHKPLKQGDGGQWSSGWYSRRAARL